jgi:HEAT repeat protein
MNRSLISALLALGLLLGTQLASAQDAQPRAQLETLLLGYDVVSTPDQLRAAAKDPQAALLQIEADPKASPILRLQAIDAMGRVPDARTQQRLQTLVAEAWSHDQAPRRTHRAINALMQAHAATAQPSVLKLLAHPDVQVRLTVAHAIAHFGDDAAKQALRDHAQREEDPIVLETIAELVPALR